MLPLNVLYSLMEESVWRRRRVPIMAIPSDPEVGRNFFHSQKNA